MENMIEKVARALAEAADEAFDELSYSKYEGDARAAIEAMREPTMRMIEAGAVQHGLERAIPDHPNPDLSSAAQCWRGMIDNALGQSTTTKK